MAPLQLAYKQRRSPKVRRRGFSLTEMVVVVALLGMVGAIAAPAYLRMRKDAQRPSCSESIRSIESAADQFLANGDSMTTSTQSLSIQPLLDAKYLVSDPNCPSGADYQLTIVEGTISVGHAHVHETKVTGASE